MGKVAVAGAVDYSDVSALTSVLESEQVDTVISMLPIDNDESGQAQLNLIEAAEKSTCTKRFLPSEFGMVYTKDPCPFLPMEAQAVDALEKTNLEFSLVSIGLFLDYWAAPRIPTHIRAANIIIDPENNAAVIPGDGNTPVVFTHSPVVFTHSTDTAKYTVALLDIPNWKRRYAIVTNRMTLNEAVKLAEEVKGVKFDVKYLSVEQMRKGENDLTPSMKKALPEEMHSGMKSMLALSGIGMAAGSNDIREIDDLVVKFPNIKPVTVRDVWEAWK
ncbi:SDR family [Fusarium phyllophilum]|uniref:SDR family n=1 Tax=Fusarium phyllophilum TaxID=47803 RepID=A0A8H5KBM2_9HYPO|nr:SDR family [Fusarium phyllophilum]